MNENLPKISVVTPSFNQAQFLELTIQSVICQKYPNLEYIIIDGGSTDGSVEIIKKYEPYLHFWCSEPDQGQYDAINKGFAHSTGEIMAWLNSDDLYYPWALRTVASIFSELNQINWLTSLQHGVWDADNFCTGFKQISGYAKASFLEGCHLLPIYRTQQNLWLKRLEKVFSLFLPNYLGFIQQESTFWSRELWQKAGGYVAADLELAGDFELWSRFCLHTEPHTTNSPIGGFRRRPDQKSQQIRKYVDEAQIALETLRSELGYSPNFFKNLVTKFGIYQYTGRKVVRSKKTASEQLWDIQCYKFF